MRYRHCWLMVTIWLSWVGCGYDSPVVPSTTALVGADVTQQIPANSRIVLSRTITTSGEKVTFAMFWGSPAVNLDVYVTDGQCVSLPQVPLGGSCNVVAFSTNINSASEQVTFNGGVNVLYKFWALNPTNVEQSVVYRILR